MNEIEHTLQGGKIYSLIPLEEFKLILGIDDRDDKLSRFCLVTAAYTIEQYCKRRLVLKRHRQLFTEWRDLTLFLNEYPVCKVLQMKKEKKENKKEEIIKSEFYFVIPDYGTDFDVPFEIRLSPAVMRMNDIKALRVIYIAGYSFDDVPADLKAACLELATWNFNRYKSRKIGINSMSNDKGARNKEGFEMSMPENVKALLEPYRRKMI